MEAVAGTGVTYGTEAMAETVAVAETEDTDGMEATAGTEAVAVTGFTDRTESAAGTGVKDGMEAVAEEMVRTAVTEA